MKHAGQSLQHETTTLEFAKVFTSQNIAPEMNTCLNTPFVSRTFSPVRLLRRQLVALPMSSQSIQGILPMTY
ncbi:MAG TPA: hypothetical protein DCE55_25290 [Planctomycetaceae bacterium]|nr:hypothetical protein [Planctomycetaceae bacterium]